jgi:hypothetical protein
MPELQSQAEGGADDLPTENGFVGILGRKEESQMCAQQKLPTNHRRDPGCSEAHRKRVQDATR